MTMTTAAVISLLVAILSRTRKERTEKMVRPACSFQERPKHKKKARRGHDIPTLHPFQNPLRRRDKRVCRRQGISRPQYLFPLRLQSPQRLYSDVFRLYRDPVRVLKPSRGIV